MWSSVLPLDELDFNCGNESSARIERRLGYALRIAALM